MKFMYLLILLALLNMIGHKRPQCFLCGNALANGSLNLSKLSEDLTSVHREYVTDKVNTYIARFEKTGTLTKFWGFSITKALSKCIIQSCLYFIKAMCSGYSRACL